MSTVNDVFKILVTKGNQAVAPAGRKVTQLLPGQIGVFDYETGLTIAAGTVPSKFYLAVGLDTDGDTITDDIMKSSGSHIERKFVRALASKNYVAPVAMQFALKNFTADCETEYGIKVEFRNSEIYRTQGYNQFTKTYSVVTGCCDKCGDAVCPSGDANEITEQLLINVANDPANLITAVAIARQSLTAATHGVEADLSIGDEVSSEDLKALIAFNEEQEDAADKVYTDVLFTANNMAAKDFNTVATQYHKFRNTVLIPSKIEGFKCNGVLETVTEPVFEQGNGVDLKQLEYFAKGWTESPYRVSTILGLAHEKSFNADAATKYNQIAIAYDEFSVGGWLEYLNNEATIIGIPQADSTTKTGLLAILNPMFTPLGFKTLA